MQVSVLAAIIGAVLILLVLWDAFEAIIFPRRVTRRFRLVRAFYHYTWSAWLTLVRSISPGRHRETLLSIYGPLSLIVLLSFWACVLIFGFGLLYWAFGAAIKSTGMGVSLWTCLYFSGTTFFTLGLGDVTPTTPLTKLLTATEAGVGFGFLAMVIGYLPALNQSFSRREVSISLLDARAGSPPTATEMVKRHKDEHGMEALRSLLEAWEVWAAEVLESHLSYPVLAFFRSQHDNQSWLAALTAILDACALVMVGLEGACERQARLTFAMTRHAIVDLSLIFSISPCTPEADRLPAAKLALLRADLKEAGLRLREGQEADLELAGLREMYEPYLCALSNRFNLALPPWIAESMPADNWRATAGERKKRFRKSTGPRGASDEHF
jgi:hypothetical protein